MRTASVGHIVHYVYLSILEELVGPQTDCRERVSCNK